MKNLIRRIKLIFRKPRVGEIWSIDRAGKTTSFEVIGRKDANPSGVYCIWSYTFKFYDSWTWEGPISQAGPIYLAWNNTLEFGLDVVSRLPPRPSSETIPTPPTRRY